MADSYMIVHLTCPLSKESYPVVKKSIRLAEIASKLDDGAQSMKLYKDEIARTRKLYTDKRTFKRFSDDEKDPILQSMNDLLKGDEVLVFPNKEMKGGRVFLGGAIDRPFILNAISPRITHLYKGQGVGKVANEPQIEIEHQITPEEYEAAVDERIHQPLAENFDAQLGKNWPAKYKMIQEHLAQKKKSGGSLEDIRKVYENHPTLPPGVTLATRQYKEGGSIMPDIATFDAPKQPETVAIKKKSPIGQNGLTSCGRIETLQSIVATL